MRRAFNRSKASGWILASVAGVFATISGFVVVAFGQHGLDELLHPAPQILAGIPLALAIGLALLARQHLRHQPAIVTLDANGVTRPPSAFLPWSEVSEVVVTDVYFARGPHESITFRARFAPSDIAATAMERRMHNLFSDQSFFPAQVDRSVDQALTEIDAAMAEAGFTRVEPPRGRFRLLYSTRSWQVGPVTKSASHSDVRVEKGTDTPTT